MDTVYYFYSQEFVKLKEEVEKRVAPMGIRSLDIDKIEGVDLDNATHLIVSGTLEQIKLALGLALKLDVSIGIIADDSQQELMRTFDIAGTLEARCKCALEPTSSGIDLLYCDDTIVLQEVVIGDAPPLDQFDTSLKEKSLIDRAKLFVSTLKKVKQLHHTRVKLIDAHDNEIKLSCVGIVGVEYNNATFAAALISKQLGANDGKLALAILSPTSILQYMGYLFSSYISRWTPDTLPSSVGFVRSSRVRIESQRELSVLIDSTEQSATPVELHSKKQALKLSVGEQFYKQQNSHENSKDSIKVDHLPSDDESSTYLAKSIPLFSHASQMQYASLFKSLREESRVNSAFLTLLILASMIATFGLFINSSSVIIGAMLLAPLMQPIVSLSMGVLRQDNALLYSASKTTAIGVMAVILSAMSISMFIPIERLTSEMAARLSPTILDLAVAILSGVAAAYAKNNKKILSSLAGVAIAVALVPPIAVAGIALGWGEFSMFASAFLLFITNLVGIVLAAGMTFLILGYSPIHIAKKGIAIWIIVALITAIPLYSSFIKIERSANIQKALENLQIDLSKHSIVLTSIEPLAHLDTLQIRCEVVSDGYLSIDEKKELKQIIERKIGKSVELYVTFVYKI